MDRLILARHGEMASGIDASLTETGQRQALEVDAFLSRYPIDLVLTSALLRAQQTAEILNRRTGAPLYASAALNEYQLRDDGSGVESTDQAIARG